MLTYSNNYIEGEYKEVPLTPLVPEEGVAVSAAPHPFRIATVQRVIITGSTLSEILEEFQPELELRPFAHIFLSGHLIPEENWRLIRPKSGTRVEIRVVPTGGGGGKKNPIRLILQIAVLAASIFLPPLLFSEAFLAGSIIGSLTVGKLISGGILLAGGLLVNAIAPPPKSKLPQLSAGGSTGRDSPTLSIEGARNQFRPFSVIPRVLGKHRMTPPYAALPFTEIVGDDQFLRVMVTWGYGPLAALVNLKIGETDIAEFEGVEIETVLGAPGDPDMTLYPNQVFEDSFSIKLTGANATPPSPFNVRTSQVDADELSIDIILPEGLIGFPDDEANRNLLGDKFPITATFVIEYSITGADSWTPIPDSPISKRAKTTSTVRIGSRWIVARNQYDVRIKKTTNDGDEEAVQIRFNISFWTVLRTITNEDPVNLPGLAKTVIRIKASDQLNGIVDQLNAEASAKILDWNGADWVLAETSNPASIFREVLQGPGNARPIADARIDLPGLQAWHLFCANNGLEYNMVQDFPSSVFDTLRDVTSVGRASPTMIDNKWSVVIDQVQSTVIQHFTPRNSKGFRSQKLFPDSPHAFRVRFVNRDEGWRQDERIVYDDGFNVNNATKFEGLDLSGITDPDHIFKDARFHIAVARLRPEIYTLTTDVEYIICKRGDLIRVTHDVPLFGVGTGRVTVVTDDTTNVISINLDERVEAIFSNLYAVRTRGSDGSTQLNNVTVVADSDGLTDLLTFVTPVLIANGPKVGDLALYGLRGSESVELVVRDIHPQGELSATLSLLDAAPAVHTADAGPIPLYTSQLTPVTGLAHPVILDIKSDEKTLLLSSEGGFQIRMLVTLGFVSNRPPQVEQVQLRYSIDGEDDPFKHVRAEPSAGEVSILGVEEGFTYAVQARYLVQTENGNRFAGPFSPAFTHTVIGFSTLPPDVDVLLLEESRLAWTYTDSPRDFAGFRIKHNSGNDTNWATGTLLNVGLITTTEFSLGSFPSGPTRTFMVKAVDLANNESLNAANLILNLGDTPVDNVVFTKNVDEEGFTGVIVNGTVVGDDLNADLTSPGTLYLPSGNDLYLGGSAKDGDLYLPVNWLEMTFTYDFGPGIDKLPARMILEPTIVGQWMIEYRQGTDPLYLPTGADLYLPTGGDLYLPFTFTDALKPWPGAVDVTSSRSYQFKTTVEGGAVQGVIDNFDIVLDVPDESESINDIPIVPAGTRLPITKTYRTITSVSLTLQDDGGDAANAKILDRNPTGGPLVRVYDTSNVATSGVIDASIQGIKG